MKNQSMNWKYGNGHPRTRKEVTSGNNNNKHPSYNNSIRK